MTTQQQNEMIDVWHLATDGVYCVWHRKGQTAERVGEGYAKYSDAAKAAAQYAEQAGVALCQYVVQS